MSILIKDMKRPKSAEKCVFYEIVPFRPYPCCHAQPGGSCGFPDRCPLVEVPKYGRLIDAAELQREAYDMLFRGHADDRDVAFLNFVLRKVPTVATAAEEATQ